ncbi:hypothetical protein MtrunA17_Chr2g0312981 [Medicago truncatula]|uniref:VQ motif protein n=1 Tax=Medicago truncatula TaxID=3880 RepID=A0A072VAK4_MEDTR|nr:VQ motif protein [Medicago truncatula]RHN74681.1 hypothetical protein MtrunA17_Chr2g0312981 [Medicago truncatula]
MSSGGCSRNPVKIVIINTQYVETDATSFKSVVQKLTGKDSDAEGEKVQRKKNNQSDVSFKEFDMLLNEMPLINDFWSDTMIN